ncbi:hypothetical protein [Nocardia sp. NPDC057030]|uniref:hypothetical protein n=1 Tax=unclassified Nocardia TaxID=2637762 RepID=UPI003625631C
MTDYTIKRDFFQRPWITTDGGPLQYRPDRKSPTNAVAYTRISTLAETLDDKSGLLDWAAANAALGVVRDPALFAQLAHLTSAHRDPWSVPEAKRQLKPLIARAQQVAGSDDAAGMGTAFHGLAQLVDEGVDPEFAPPHLRPWIAEYRAALSGWEVLDCEPFVVVDEIQGAGSMDRLLRHRATGRVVCADIKTGRADPDFPLKVTMQVAMYSRGQRYDQETGTRAPLHPDVDLAHGLLIHVPIRSGEPRAALYPLDLTEGWELAQIAVRVRAARRMPKLAAVA